MVRRKQSATVQLTLRMKEPLRAQIKRSAKRRGLSLNAEIVDQLERVYTYEESELKAFGSEAIYDYMKLLAMAIKTVENITNGKWLKDNKTTRESLAAIYGIMGAFGHSSPDIVRRQTIAQGRRVGIDVAIAALRLGGLSDERIKREFLGIGGKRKSQLLTGQPPDEGDGK